MESALDLLATKAADKGLDLAYLIAPNTPEAILGDVTRLRQILVNLLSNAVKFTERGEVVVSLASEPIPAGTSDATSDRTVLHFAVRDSGIGIPPDRVNRLFQSFSQVDASTTRRYGGTGLGLAISKRLSELMGGTMWVESVPGTGSTFHFTIRATAAAAPLRVYLDEAQPLLQGKRVLIVDDNATNRLILSRQVESWHMLPQALASPVEALQWLRERSTFDVALLDMQMPDMDGLSLAQEIRALPVPVATAPLILLTSLGRREVKAEAAEFAAFLTKPLKPSALFNALVAIFSGQPTRILARQADAAPQFDPQMGQRHPLRILLAEDNATNQKLALRILARLGYQADVVSNGLEALEALLRQPYDVVLMDVQMPELDGLETTRRLRTELAQPRQPQVIAMTANAMQGDRELCLAAGMDDYVSKPIRVDELVRALAASSPLAASPENDSEIDVKPPAADAGGQAVGPSESLGARETAPDTAVLDPKALQRLLATVGGEFAFLAELIDSFLADAPQLLAELERFAQAGDAAGVRRVAHSLKSNGADLGATAFTEQCKELEEMGKTGALDDAAARVALLEIEYRRVTAALTTVRTAGISA